MPTLTESIPAQHLFFYGLLVPVTPTALKTRAGIPEEDLQKWNSVLQALYGTSIVITSPVAGWVADRTRTRRSPYILCLAVLAVSTGLLAAGTSLGLWITARILHGVSAGMLWPICLALLSDTVGQADIGKAVGIIGIPMSIGPIVGPLLGGVIYTYGGYYAVFGVMFALLAIDAVLRIVMIEKKVASQWLGSPTPPAAGTPALARLDGPVGASALEAKLCTLTNQETGPALPKTETPVEHREPVASGGAARPSPDPNQPRWPIVSLLLSFRMFASLTGGLLQSCLNVAFDSTLPFVVEDLFGWSQTGQGLIFITILVPSLLQPVFGMITDRFQQGRRLMSAGGCFLATPAYALLQLVTHDSLEQKVLLCILLVIIGLAMAMAMPAIIAEIGALVEEEKQKDPEGGGKADTIATGWSLVNCTYAAGCMLGPLYSGLIRNSAGWETTTWSLAILSGVTATFLLTCLGGWLGFVAPKMLVTRVVR
ncbi:MFS general substrate transporter [Thozetella sp. PMI_491]|nr:MFS general substrate transporter [Thozetella sp. PMI_491]